MPEHILSGIKAIVAMKLRRKGLLQKEIAEIIKSDRSIVSHYLSGRYPKEKILKVAEIFEELPPKYGAKLIHSLTDDKELAKNLIEELYNIKFLWDEKSCIACGSCLGCVALTLDNFTVNIDYDACFLCASCIFRCPTNSLNFVRENYD
ncbi:(4Fe-4S)-binding protein [Methanocaldococcus fervens]|uniref:4Fe-4S ferredoxin iron-sulfur binding domain protein n=1 Tax=Methanocaldococcus fervens (strain DSM 4213 / JCM 15782 / AG86) TaxID=573064 RepID=C7P619_METFA|nr:(4Fe-4S)-binding protein [Methanocaldococcus fervens]ACV24001.1 4Fe-4S ferredoxin iron-sulfur binding domain protein [Methanocaldococcus fervens AG86]